MPSCSVEPLTLMLTPVFEVWSIEAELPDTVADEVASETMSGEGVGVGVDASVGAAVDRAAGVSVASGTGEAVEAGEFTVTAVAVEFTFVPALSDSWRMNVHVPVTVAVEVAKS